MYEFIKDERLRQEMISNHTYLEEIKDFKRKDRERGILGYLIYQYKGEIKIKKGKIGRNFYPLSKPSTYQTGIPSEIMKVSSTGKVLVTDEKDIPEAVNMLQKYYLLKKQEVKDRTEAANRNIESIINQKEFDIC